MLLDHLDVESEWRGAVEHVLGHALTARCVSDLDALIHASLSVAPPGTYLIAEGVGRARREEHAGGKNDRAKGGSGAFAERENRPRPR